MRLESRKIVENWIPAFAGMTYITEYFLFGFLAMSNRFVNYINSFIINEQYARLLRLRNGLANNIIALILSPQIMVAGSSLRIFISKT
jgi:hypothetical protein